MIEDLMLQRDYCHYCQWDLDKAVDVQIPIGHQGLIRILLLQMDDAVPLQQYDDHYCCPQSGLQVGSREMLVTGTNLQQEFPVMALEWLTGALIKRSLGLKEIQMKMETTIYFSACASHCIPQRHTLVGVMMPISIWKQDHGKKLWIPCKENSLMKILCIEM
jgi:hypothetical protein